MKGHLFPSRCHQYPSPGKGLLYTMHSLWPVWVLQSTTIQYLLWLIVIWEICTFLMWNDWFWCAIPPNTNLTHMQRPSRGTLLSALNLDGVFRVRWVQSSPHMVICNVFTSLQLHPMMTSSSMWKGSGKLIPSRCCRVAPLSTFVNLQFCRRTSLDSDSGKRIRHGRSIYSSNFSLIALVRQ